MGLSKFKIYQFHRQETKKCADQKNSKGGTGEGGPEGEFCLQCLAQGLFLIVL